MFTAPLELLLSVPSKVEITPALPAEISARVDWLTRPSLSTVARLVAMMGELTLSVSVARTATLPSARPLTMVLGAMVSAAPESSMLTTAGSSSQVPLAFWPRVSTLASAVTVSALPEVSTVPPLSPPVAEASPAK
ncbi:hypothetical protein D9M69_667620 [compost metagenome]